MSSQQNFNGNTTVEFIAVALSFGLSLMLFIFVCILCNRRLQSVGFSASARCMLPSTGLRIDEISVLPTFAYQTRSDDGADDSAECAICLTQVQQREMVRLLPNCKHFFHVQCIDMWLCSHSTCPVCRTDVRRQIEAETDLEHGNVAV